MQATPEQLGPALPENLEGHFEPVEGLGGLHLPTSEANHRYDAAGDSLVEEAVDPLGALPPLPEGYETVGESTILGQLPDFDIDGHKIDHKNEHGRDFQPSVITHGREVTHAIDERGHQQIGFKFQSRNEVIELEKLRTTPIGYGDNRTVMPADNRERQIVLTARDQKAGSNYYGYIRGNKLYEIITRPGEEPDISMQRLRPGQKLPNLKIGENLSTGGDSEVEAREVRKARKEGRDADDPEGFVLSSVEIRGDKVVGLKDNPQAMQAKRKKLIEGGARPAKKENVEEEDDKNKHTGIYFDLKLDGPEDPFVAMERFVHDLHRVPDQRSHRGPIDMSNYVGPKKPDVVPKNTPSSEASDKIREISGMLSEVLEKRAPEKIREIAQLLRDGTYVPTPERFKEMRLLADMINESDVSEDGVRTMGGESLDSDDADILLYSAELDTWALHDFQMKHYSKGLKLPAVKLKDVQILQDGQLGGILTIPRFNHIRERQISAERLAAYERGEEYIAPGKLQLAKEYKVYLQKRLELGALIKEIREEERFTKRTFKRKGGGSDTKEADTEEMPTREMGDGIYDWQNDPDLASELASGRPGREEELEVPAFVTANDVAFRALRDYRKWQAENTLGAQAKRVINRGLDRMHSRNMKIDGAVRNKMDKIADKAAEVPGKIDKGLNRVHRGNMKVDATVQKGMDKAAERASKVKAKARNYKDMWNESANRPISEMSSETVAQEALKEYVRWQREQKDKNRPRAVVSRNARKAAAKLRRRSA